MLRHTTTSGHLTKTQVVAVYEADGERDPDVFNTAMAKQLKKLKKDIPGVQNVRQNYKGTGKQKFRRQVWIRFAPDTAEMVDLWLGKAGIQVGGVSVSSSLGRKTIPTEGRSVQEVYRDVLAILKRHAMKESVMKKPVESYLHTRRTVAEGHLRRSTTSEELSEAQLQSLRTLDALARKLKSLRRDDWEYVRQQLIGTLL